MYPAADSITGLIEFDPSEARLALQTRCGSDETLQATLVSLAQDLLEDADEAGSLDAEWSESQIDGDLESLERELLLIYLRVKSR